MPNYTRYLKKIILQSPKTLIINPLQSITIYYNLLLYITIYYYILQSITIYYNLLLYITIYYYILQRITIISKDVKLHQSVGFFQAFVHAHALQAEVVGFADI